MIEQLRKDGYKVRVIHNRKIDFSDFPKTTIKFPQGGVTRVEVRTPDGKELVGEAVCHPEENYNKKLGVKIALGRALKGETFENPNN